MQLPQQTVDILGAVLLLHESKFGPFRREFILVLPPPFCFLETSCQPSALVSVRTSLLKSLGLRSGGSIRMLSTLDSSALFFLVSEILLYAQGLSRKAPLVYVLGSEQILAIIEYRSKDSR